MSAIGLMNHLVPGPDPMRAEAEQLVETIKQSVGLLRRHL
jgi:hypothetical protein